MAVSLKKRWPDSGWMPGCRSFPEHGPGWRWTIRPNGCPAGDRPGYRTA
ncbi:hypothetical protein [Bacillus cereus]|nr:hypothetical protein [Bacillus cereus]